MTEFEQLMQAYEAAWQKLQATPEWKAWVAANKAQEAAWEKLEATPEWKAKEAALQAKEAS
jgi:lysozyme family protein